MNGSNAAMKSGLLADLIAERVRDKIVLKTHLRSLI
jgi:hypothetical protein